MLRFAKTIGCLALLALGWQSALGFSLLGPNANGDVPDGWQEPVIGYKLPDDIGTPKNIGEEFRWNTPVIYYAFNQTFTDYFGSNGVWAVEQAIAVLNGLTNFSKYSADLSEVPLETRRVNYRAQALHLYDLKTLALYLTTEELGLTKPDQYVWTLRDRFTQAGLSCPFMVYRTIKRNFDPVNWQPTSYINGTLYSYLIQEFCTGPNPLAFNFNFSVDPLAVESIPLMSLRSFLGYGLYATKLTRDDVGGLRYSYRPSNINWEAMSSDSVMFYTNVAGGQQLLITSNLTLLAAQALTNNAAALQTLYPNLNIVATTNIFTNIWVTNLTAYFTNYAWDPIGMPPRLGFITNRTLTVQNWFHHIFANVVTFQLINGAWVTVPVPDVVLRTGPALYTVQTTSVTNSPYAPVGTPPFTNTTSFTYAINDVVGEFFILPTNLCGVAISGLQATLINSYTNVVVSETNAPPGTTNAQSFTRTIINYSTNHAFTYFPVDCLATNVTLRQGIDKFTFVRANYDSVVGRFFQPITNIYSQVCVTNSLPVTNWFMRVVAKPDYLYAAEDQLTTLASRSSTGGSPPNFNDANADPLLAGPGNIDPGARPLPAPPAMEIIFNKVGPLLQNVYNTNFLHDGLSELEGTTNFIWGSYDGSTNDPVVYPDGTSIANLEAQILFQILTPSLPDGKVGTAYTPTQLQASGGQPPYVWSLASGSPALPPGLSLSATGTISGTPTTRGTYVFTVSAAGGDARATARTLSIIISP